MTGPAVILYDGDCGFCTWATRRILTWDRKARLRAVPIVSEEGERLLAGMDPARRLSSWHVRTADGEVYSAGAAVPPLMRLLPGGAPLAVLASAFPAATERVYRWVADRRGRLGRRTGTAACGTFSEPRGGRVAMARTKAGRSGVQR